jgi:hypothetical protein
MAPRLLPFRRSQGSGAPERPASRPPRLFLPPPGRLRRQRRDLLRLREERLRDLGGLVLEMFRQDSFREGLLYDQCNEIAAIEARVQELDSLLAATSPGRAGPTGRCACGATLIWGSHFCANCGRPAGETIVACASCGHALPADADYCPSCAAPVERGERSAAPAYSAEPTVVRPPNGDDAWGR